MKRSARTLAPLAVLLALLAGRATACKGRKGAATPAHGPAVTAPAHWVTPLMTPPPPRPTPTMWKGVTRAPQLPE